MTAKPQSETTFNVSLGQDDLDRIKASLRNVHKKIARTSYIEVSPDLRVSFIRVVQAHHRSITRIKLDCHGSGKGRIELDSDLLLSLTAPVIIKIDLKSATVGQIKIANRSLIGDGMTKETKKDLLFETTCEEMLRLLDIASKYLLVPDLSETDHAWTASGKFFEQNIRFEGQFMYCLNGQFCSRLNTLKSYNSERGFSLGSTAVAEMKAACKSVCKHKNKGASDKVRIYLGMLDPKCGTQNVEASYGTESLIMDVGDFHSFGYISSVRNEDKQYKDAFNHVVFSPHPPLCSTKLKAGVLFDAIDRLEQMALAEAERLVVKEKKPKERAKKIASVVVVEMRPNSIQFKISPQFIEQHHSQTEGDKQVNNLLIKKLAVFTTIKAERTYAAPIITKYRLDPIFQVQIQFLRNIFLNFQPDEDLTISTYGPSGVPTFQTRNAISALGPMTDETTAIFSRMLHRLGYDGNIPSAALYEIDSKPVLNHSPIDHNGKVVRVKGIGTGKYATGILFMSYVEDPEKEFFDSPASKYKPLIRQPEYSMRGKISRMMELECHSNDVKTFRTL